MKEQHGPIKEQHGFVSDGQRARHFGNYDLVRRIDMGGMGEVYLARQRTAFGREVAVKIIRSDLVHDVTARKRFLREAEVSAHLKHEHILPLFEFGEEQGRLFLVTPYIEGGTLARRLQSGPLSFSEAYQLFSALVQAIAYIHKRGVIHRDLKPPNILLDQEEDQVYIRLIDFGIASLQGAVASPPLTTAGNEMGTIAYMAPERLNGIAAPSNDIYSLGVILYQMLVGHLPTPDNPAQTHLPQPLEAVIRRCTAMQVEERYTSADELLQSFKQAYKLLAAQPQTPVEAPAISVAPAAQPEAEDGAPTPRRLTTISSSHTAHTTNTASRKSRSTPRGALPLSLSEQPFSSEDYNAPTTFLDPARITGKHRSLADEAVIVKTPARPQSRSRRALFGLIPLAIVVVLLIIAMTGVLVFQAAISAQISLTPQVQSVNKMLTITAKPGLVSVDQRAASIPLNSLSSTKTQSKTGPTSGRFAFLCDIGLTSNCPKIVATEDVSTVGLQLKQEMMTQITQDLTTQLRTKNASALTKKPTFTDGRFSWTPQLGERSDNVTVTLTEQGAVNYYSNTDLKKLTRFLLQQQVGTNYQLVDALTQIGQPVIKGASDNGGVILQVPTAGVAQYQFSPTELQSFQEHIKGMKLKDARAFLEKQPGVDAKAVVVTVTYGDTLPGDIRQIKLTQVNATNLPAVQLPK